MTRCVVLLCLSMSAPALPARGDWGDIGGTCHFCGTRLHQAVLLGRADVVLAMLGAGGVDVDARDLQGETPLHLAAWLGDAVSVRALLAHGADVHARNRDGQTPLDLADRYGRRSVVALLAGRGTAADPAASLLPAARTACGRPDP